MLTVVTSDKTEYLRSGNCLIARRSCTLAGANLAGSPAGANRIQMRRQSEQKLLNNIPLLHSCELYAHTTRNDAVTARSMHFTTSSFTLTYSSPQEL